MSSFNSGNSTTTVWGLGWTSESDQMMVVTNLAPVVTWIEGSGAQLNFFNVSAASAAPSYTTPVNTYVTLTAVTSSSGVPTALLEKDKDGTSRLFTVFESTAILRLNLLTDRNGNTITYTRDNQGRLTRVTDVHGRYFQIAYNAAGYVATLTDSGGRTSNYSYDAQGHMTSVAGPLGTTAYQYDAGNRMTKVTYPNGGVHDYSYDAQNRVLSEDDGAGQNALSYVYNASSTTVTDALGRTTLCQYTSVSGLKKPLSVTDPAGNVTSYTYDANLNMTSMTDPLGRTTHYTYDSNGNVTVTQDAAGGATRASYEPKFNQPTSMTDPLNHTTNNAYDNLGDLTQVQNPLSGLTKNSYDPIGHVTQTQDPLNLATGFTYTPSNGALASTTDPLSRTTQFQTDPLSRVTRNTDPSGQSTQYQYDAAGDMTQATDALGHATVYAYGAGRTSKLLSAVTDANGHQTSFGYDAQGRQTSVTNALNQTKSSVYDAKGNLIQTTNARGQVIAYAYDNLDRLTRKTLPEGQINYTYDAAGNQLSASSYNGSSIQNTYDSLNRLTQTVQTLPNGYAATIGYSYDAAGNRTGMTTPWGSFSYAYDALNRLTKITNPQGKQFAFTYDSDSRRTSLSYPNGIVTNYTYDSAGQVLSIIARRTSDGVIISSQAYTYDAAGDRTSMTDVEGTHTYGYDNLHRLTSALHPAGTVLPVQNETFSYDPVGNRLADAAISGYTYNSGNELISNSSFTYAYDADGNLASKTDTASNQTTYSFDSQNVLSGAATNGVNWTYLYDAEGRRVEKSSGTAPGQATFYVYDSQNILAMLDTSNNPILLFTNTLNIDEPLLIHRSDTDYSVHQDAIDSVRVHASTSGAIAESVAYEAYGIPAYVDVRSGAPVPESGLSFTGDPLCFAGRECDGELQFINMRARQTYDPQAGRFFQSDPIGTSVGPAGMTQSAVKSTRSRIQPYDYAFANPVDDVDPFGLAPPAHTGKYYSCQSSCYSAYAYLLVPLNGVVYTAMTLIPIGIGAALAPEGAALMSSAVVTAANLFPSYNSLSNHAAELCPKIGLTACLDSCAQANPEEVPVGANDQ